jgi:hypothetical protein
MILSIIRPGSTVSIANGTITDAKVVEVIIYPTDIAYKISWWVNGTRNEQILPDFEVTNSVVKQFVNIGFKTR